MIPIMNTMTPWSLMRNQHLFFLPALLKSGIKETDSDKAEIHLHVSKNAHNKNNELTLDFGTLYQFKYVKITNLVHYGAKPSYQSHTYLSDKIFKTKLKNKAGKISFDLTFKFKNHPDRHTRKFKNHPDRHTRKVIIHVED